MSKAISDQAAGRTDAAFSLSSCYVGAQDLCSARRQQFIESEQENEMVLAL